MMKTTKPDLRGTANLADDIKTIMSNPGFLEKVTDPPTMEQWLDFIHEYLEPKHTRLTDEIINRALSEYEAMTPFTYHFPGNFTCCFTLIPCNPAGNKYSDEELVFTPQLYRIMVPSENAGESAQKLYRHHKWLYDLMPEEIRNLCSFQIKYRVKPYAPGFNPEKARTEILVKCANALINLQKLLRRKK